jgi:hypothetical protein
LTEHPASATASPTRRLAKKCVRAIRVGVLASEGTRSPVDKPDSFR